MDTKKFEALIDLIINENEEQARALFHDIVVEKSREIYEGMMMDEMGDDMEEGIGGQVGDMMDEISAEESGMVEDDESDMDDDMVGDEMDDIDFDDDAGEIEDGEVVDIEGGDGEVEGRLDSIEDKLDQLMSEFEEIMADEEGEEDFDDEEEAADDEEMAADDEEDDEEEEDTLEEAITLKKVSVTHGDNGANAKSISLNSPKVNMGKKPVTFAGYAETVPTGPKGPSNYGTKGEGEVKHSKEWKNAPAQAGQDLEKAPAPKKTPATGINNDSVVANESRRATKKMIKPASSKKRV